MGYKKAVMYDFFRNVWPFWLTIKSLIQTGTSCFNLNKILSYRKKERFEKLLTRLRLHTARNED